MGQQSAFLHPQKTNKSSFKGVFILARSEILFLKLKTFETLQTSEYTRHLLITKNTKKYETHTA